MIGKTTASLLLFLGSALPAVAQTQVGPESWPSSILKAPSAMPQSGDVVGFVHNGLTYKCVFGSTGCFSGGSASSTLLIGGDASSCLLIGGDATSCLLIGGS